jgi:hypothetical protein
VQQRRPCRVEFDGNTFRRKSNIEWRFRMVRQHFRLLPYLLRQRTGD